MPQERQVYLLDPQKLPPETIAVTFAKTSRSPESFREIAAELTEEKSSQFHEKWVVGYGHSSVAEHAVLHIAVENVSRLAIEALESNRLAAYTEKSTRYQKWGPESFFIPPELEGHPLYPLYLQTIRRLFDAYTQALPAVRKVVQDECPCQAGESENAWERRIRSEYVDCCRFLLPAASLANVGMTINARALEHAITKLLSHPLTEVRQLGEEIKRVAQAEVPTLVKYANASPYLEMIGDQLSGEAAKFNFDFSANPDWCTLVSYDPEGELRLLAASLYRFSDADYLNIQKTVQNMSALDRQRIANILLGKIDRFEIPLRELEYTSYTFDLLFDQGAYFEFKRHRMMTQTPQALTAHLGFAIPKRIEAAGLLENYSEAMEAARSTYDKLAEFNPHVASYIVPNAFNRRVLASFNLRSADHFVSLRTAPNAHFSIRRLAYRMAELICAKTPLLGSCLHTSPGETWQVIESRYFTRLR